MSMAMQTNSTHARTDDEVVLDLGIADSGPVMPAAGPALRHFAATAGLEMPLAGLADRRLLEIDRAPTRTWPGCAEVDLDA